MLNCIWTCKKLKAAVYIYNGFFLFTDYGNNYLILQN